jgi:ribose transport system ATP-binding protein
MHDTSIPEIISLMVGRKISQDQRPENRGKHVDVVLKVEGLSTPTLLQDVSFDLRRGEILGFAGLIGAGRTELARAIIGADPKSAGKIFVNGQESNIKDPSDGVAAGIGYLSEDRKKFGLMLGQNVTFNVILASIPRFINKIGFFKGKPAKEIAKNYIETLRIRTPSERQIVKNLSGGNQQKVILGRWLSMPRKVIILEEPTAGVDVGAKTDIYSLIEEATKQKLAVLLVSTDFEEVALMAHRALVFSEGEIVKELQRSEITVENLVTYASRANVGAH